jgi:hypothetical protein
MKNLGRILWWDEKLKRGAIESSDGKEFLFDASSVVSKISRRSVGKIVQFAQDKKSRNALLAKQVELAAVKELRSDYQEDLNRLRELAA